MIDPLLEKGLLVVVCAYNEEERIAATLKEIKAECGDVEVVVVDDGSTDSTADVAAASGVTMLRLPFNLGYGAALQTGYRYARKNGYKYVVQMDADGQHVARYVSPLIEEVFSNHADVAIGSRFLEHTGYKMEIRKRIVVWVLRMIILLVTGKKVTDPTSGFQALGERAINLYSSDVYPVDFPDADVIIMLHKMGLRFVEVPVEMRPSPRKRTIHSGLLSLYYVFKMFLSILVGLMRKGSGGSAKDREEGRT